VFSIDFTDLEVNLSKSMEVLRNIWLPFLTFLYFSSKSRVFVVFLDFSIGEIGNSGSFNSTLMFSKRVSVIGHT
jgi:hypothetical protein